MRNVLAALEDSEAFVSTGQLPDPEKVTAIVTEAYEHFRSNLDGRNSNVYPALQRVGSNLFGVCVAATGGNVFAIGDADYEFATVVGALPLAGEEAQPESDSGQEPPDGYPRALAIREL